jgi:5-methylcytosine-specific restriction endonuclease McrA
MTWALPTPEEQVLFLRNMQRLLSEGLFVASYKFALVHALADLAVLKGDDSGSPLELSTKEIAAKFVELYWRQSRPFPVGGESSGLVLQQNTGKQAAIIAKIALSQQEFGGSLFRLKQGSPDQWHDLVAEVDTVVRTMPLWKLQTVGNEPLEFLYDNVGKGTKITLKPGVSYCLRAFYELIRDLIEGAWVRFVQKLNANKLGNITDLGSFLFGNERACLDSYRPILMDVQKGTCLYCQKSLTQQSQVDHFIPWSRFPADLGHNFVLAHDKCNNAKSDFLAAERHLEAWLKRNREYKSELQERLIASALPCDLGASMQVAKWMYQQTEKSNGQVWVMEKVLKHLDLAWAKCFAA